VTSTKTTIRKLLQSGDSTLNGFIAFWKEYKRAPAPLIDWCLEQGLESAADAVRWAVEKEDRSAYGNEEESVGPYPWCQDKDCYSWWADDAQKEDHNCDEIPMAVITKMRILKWTIDRSRSFVQFRTFEDAICGLLDCWS
jgi:hypothetical protein